MKPAEERRAELEQHIASSRTVQKGSVIAGAIVALLGLALGSLPILLIGLGVGGAGFWITWGHIDDFQKELRVVRGRRQA